MARQGAALLREEVVWMHRVKVCSGYLLSCTKDAASASALEMQDLLPNRLMNALSSARS